MEQITCPYCGSEVSMADVEKEGGACPECGAMMAGSLLMQRDQDAFGEDGDEFAATNEFEDDGGDEDD